VIKLVITDLDNTIYNWVDFYVPSFNAMVGELARLTKIDEESLKQSFKRVHQKHRTSEYAFSIEELDILAHLNRNLTTGEILAKYASAVQAFRRVRSMTLRLYEGVEETFEQIRSNGRRIVGHTDAMMFYAISRIKQLNIEHLFDGIVAPRDHGLPEGVRPEDVRSSSDSSKYETTIPVKDELEPNAVKPDAKVLNKILSDFGVLPFEALYVGDSLNKDIYMAQLCGVHDVYAQYGRNFNPNHYRELVQITHWSEDDVAREFNLKKLNVVPSFSLSSFSDLLRVIQEIEGQNRDA
jgi:FMN phosphatase YigB (HAD superfamily)